jgi:hypothetical protein
MYYGGLNQNLGELIPNNAHKNGLIKKNIYVSIASRL